jgi:hypothetical protein
MADQAEKPATSGSRRQKDREPVALALASGRTIRESAEAGHVSERSVRNWLGDPAFVARVRALRAEMYAAAVGKLADLSGKAADALGGLLQSEAEQVRLQAAKAVLEVGSKLREQADLADEVEKLRQLVEGQVHESGDASPGRGPAPGAASHPADRGTPADAGETAGGPGQGADARGL